MKTTFSRTFTAITVLIVAAMVILGISFQLLVSNYLRDSAMEQLIDDGRTIVQLVQAYVSDEPINDRDFGIALSVAASVSDADAVSGLDLVGAAFGDAHAPGKGRGARRYSQRRGQ